MAGQCPDSIPRKLGDYSYFTYLQIDEIDSFCASVLHVQALHLAQLDDRDLSVSASAMLAKTSIVSVWLTSTFGSSARFLRALAGTENAPAITRPRSPAAFPLPRTIFKVSLRENQMLRQAALLAFVCVSQFSFLG